MDPTPDELAGVADLFGGLTRDELGEALAELAFKRGDEYDPDAFAAGIDDAVATYHLVSVEPDGAAVDAGAPVLVPGPAAFPALPEDAEDLLHILEIDPRSVDRDAARTAAVERFRAETARAVAAGDGSRMATLLDVSYELEAWASVDLGEVRARLDAVE